MIQQHQPIFYQGVTKDIGYNQFLMSWNYWIQFIFTVYTVSQAKLLGLNLWRLHRETFSTRVKDIKYVIAHLSEYATCLVILMML